MLPWAIQSKAILPGEVRCVFHRDEQDAHAQRQNGIAGFPDHPAANRCSSKPTTVDPEPTASPKSADDRGCAASAWGWLHDPAFAAGPAKVVSLVPKHSWSSRYLLNTMIRHGEPGQDVKNMAGLVCRVQNTTKTDLAWE
jgi:hypothetical protein